MTRATAHPSDVLRIQTEQFDPVALYRCHPNINRCAGHMHDGGVVAYPTESVWGLGCDPFNEHAVTNILELKNRSVDKGVILVASDIRQFEFILRDLPWSQRERLLASWPGPNTWLVPHGNWVPEWISGKHETVALRVSAHPVVAALCGAFGGPIVSTSANPQSYPAAKTQTQARCYFRYAGKALIYSAGAVGKFPRPSTIRDLISGEVLRD